MASKPRIPTVTSQVARQSVTGFQRLEIDVTNKEPSEMDGTPQDQNDMSRMGKVQEFKAGAR